MSRMSTTLLLVRHAQTLSNTTGRYMGWAVDDDLSDKGVYQADRLSRRLGGLSIAAVYSSPLKRALRTAETLALPHSLPVEILEALGEMRLGAWEGMFAQDIAAKFPDLWQTWRSEPSGIQMPGGESLAQVQDRAVAAFKHVARANDGRLTIIVTHDVVVRLLVAHCLDVGTAIYRRLEVSNASLTIIQVTDGKCRLRLLNDTSHLAGD
jgi:broad specificity phosphatase PhoE